VVFRTNGFSVVLDEDATGEDFDGDGKPDVVLRTDTGGGMHCCRQYIVYSLSRQPHKLFDLAENGKVDMEKDKEGRMTIWQRTGGLMILTSSMANRSFAEKVLQVRDGKLADVTAEFCGLNDNRFERYEPTPDALKKLTNTAQPSRYDDDVERIIAALESRTLQHVYCQQFDEAVKDFSLWPIEKRKIEIWGFEDALAKDYPEFAAKLREVMKNN